MNGLIVMDNILKKKFYIYFVNNSCFFEVSNYALPRDEFISSINTKVRICNAFHLQLSLIDCYISSD